MYQVWNIKRNEAVQSFKHESAADAKCYRLNMQVPNGYKVVKS